jgi:regulator of RNase E activity RraB
MSEEERMKLGGLRPLGSAEGREDKPEAPPELPEPLKKMAREMLESQFVEALVLKAKLLDEGGRDPEGTKAKIGALIASLEGASKIALKLGLIDVQTNKQLFADAMERGLYEGWR